MHSQGYVKACHASHMTYFPHHVINVQEIPSFVHLNPELSWAKSIFNWVQEKNPKKIPQKFLKIPQKFPVQNTSTYRQNEVTQKVRKSPSISLSHDDETSLPPKWASIPHATDQSSSPQDASMPNCSSMVEVEVEDKDYLPLTSVPVYTCGSD